MKMYALRHTFHEKNVLLITLCTTDICVYLFAKPSENFTCVGLSSLFRIGFFANVGFFPNSNPVEFVFFKLYDEINFLLRPEANAMLEIKFPHS